MPLRNSLAIGLVCVLCLAGKTYFESLKLAADRPLPSLTITSAQYQGKSLKRFSLGFDSMLSGILWVQLLQKASHTQFNSGQVSWEYAQLNSILSLDPKFIRAYDFGSSFLSVFRRDKIGAKKILEQWVKNYPRSWKAHYILAYHLYAEIGDYAAAAPLMLKAASLENAPTWLPALGLRLVSESGALLSALQLAIELYEGVTDEEGRIRIRQRIRSLRFALEKKSWEKALVTYREKQKQEPASIADVAPYRNEQMRDIASFASHVTIPEDLHETFREKFSFHYGAGSREIEAELRAEDRFLTTTGIYRPKE